MKIQDKILKRRNQICTINVKNRTISFGKHTITADFLHNFPELQITTATFNELNKLERAGFEVLVKKFADRVMNLFNNTKSGIGSISIWERN